MSLSKVGFNVSGMGNITSPSIDINTTIQGILVEIPQRANQITGGNVGIIIMTTLFVYLYWSFNDNTEFADYGFSTLRAISIASGIVGLIGTYMLAIGFFTVFYHVVIFLTINFMTALWIIKEER